MPLYILTTEQRNSLLAAAQYTIRQVGDHTDNAHVREALLEAQDALLEPADFPTIGEELKVMVETSEAGLRQAAADTMAAEARGEL